MKQLREQIEDIVGHLWLKEAERSFSGETEIYDTSIAEYINIGPEVKGTKVLDIGPGGMSSSLDMITMGAKEAWAVEPCPFGLPLVNERANKLVNLKASQRSLNTRRLTLIQRPMGDALDLLPRDFNRVYFFFPNVPQVSTLLGYYETSSRIFADTVLAACSCLTESGKLIITTEVDMPYLNEVQVNGFKRSTSRKSGLLLYSKQQLMQRDNNFTRIKPADSLALTFIKYERC